MNERWCVVANVVEPCRFRMGAKVRMTRLIPGDGETGEFQGLSPGGRRITAWVQLRRLARFRPDVVPFQIIGWSAWPAWLTKEDAQDYIDRRWLNPTAWHLAEFVKQAFNTYRPDHVFPWPLQKICDYLKGEGG